MIAHVVGLYNMQSRLRILRLDDLTVEEEHWLGVLVREILREEAKEAEKRRSKQ